MNIYVKAIRVKKVDEYYDFRACVNPSITEWSGYKINASATSSSTYTEKEVSVTVPAGEFLTIWNNNDVKTIWTITYN